MRKTTVAIAIAAGFAAIGSAAAPAMAQVNPGDLSLANIDASNAAQLQVCGQNVLALPSGQDCDNSNSGNGDSGVNAGDMSAINADASDAAKWQVCGQNVLAQISGQECGNGDTEQDGPGKGGDQGDF